jgi:hypothetical protein
MPLVAFDDTKARCPARCLDWRAFCDFMMPDANFNSTTVQMLMRLVERVAQVGHKKTALLSGAAAGILCGHVGA